MAVALAGVLAGLGYPALGALIEHGRRTAAVNDLVRAVQLARMEAVKRGSSVVLCASADGETCAGHGSFQLGFVLFAARRESSPPQPTAADTVLAVGAFRARVTMESNRPAFVFRPFSARSSNGTISVCTAGRRVMPRAVIISYTGRPRTASVLPDGGQIHCPAPTR